MTTWHLGLPHKSAYKLSWTLKIFCKEVEDENKLVNEKLRKQKAYINSMIKLQKIWTVHFLSEMKETTILKQEMEKVPI